MATAQAVMQATFPETSTHVLRALQAYFAAAPGGVKRCIVATSGGPDSQALLDGIGQLTSALGLLPLAVGIDHGLRAEAGAELALAEALCQSHGLPFQKITVALPARGNLMAQARAKRYRALYQAAQSWQAEAVLTAHNLNDQAETVLFHLARGTDLRGAGGMASRRGKLHRPLLQVSREQIMQHLHHYEVPYATDPSNKDLARSRARMRLHVLPALEGINSQALAHIGAFALRARQDHALLQGQAKKFMTKCLVAPNTLCCTQLRRGPKALWPRVLHAWLTSLGCPPTAAAVTRLLMAVQSESSALAQGALKGCTVRKQGSHLVATASASLPPRRAGTLPRQKP